MHDIQNPTLLLMRHAKSDWADARLSDKDRPLNDRGRRSAPLMANWLEQHGLVPQRVLCSSAVRTRETIGLMLERWCLHSAASVMAPVVSYIDDLYLATADEIANIGQQQADDRIVLILGHNPGMQVLASNLSGLEFEMPTAAIAVFESHANSWPNPWRSANAWKWRGLVKPRDLDKEAI